MRLKAVTYHMEQLEALQRLSESISKGNEVLRDIDPDEVAGDQAQDIGALIRLRQAGEEWDDTLCCRLVEGVDDIPCLVKMGDI